MVSPVVQVYLWHPFPLDDPENIKSSSINILNIHNPFHFAGAKLLIYSLEVL